MATDVRTRLWRDGKLVAENFPLADVSDYLEQPDCLVWADLCSPDQEHLATLAEELSLDPHSVEDALSVHERPKATRYDTHLFLAMFAILRDKNTDELSASRVSAFTVRNGFVTVRLDPSFDIETVVRRWDANADLLKFGPRALVHGLLDEVIDGYFDAVGALDDEIEAVEDMLFDENPRSATIMQRRTFALRKSLVQVRRAILPMREVVNTVMRRYIDDENHHAAELAPYFEDLYDHVLRASEWTESLRDMVSTIFETNMALSDNRMNMVMKKLTAWAAIIAVPTAITGFYGQNVPYPGFGKHWGFVFSISAIFLIALALWGSFRKRDWL